MKHLARFIVVVYFALAGALPVHAEEKSQGEFHLWADLFGGQDGSVFYPQYGWKGVTNAGTFSGYGFLERAPLEPLFTNHLVVFTPGRQKVFAIHTETGGRVLTWNAPEPAGGPIPPAAFFQVGPRVNLHEAIPPMKKVMSYVFVVALPPLTGIRTTNYLLSGGTNTVTVAKKVDLSVEAYRRFFEGPDYSEYWFLIHPKVMGPVTLSVFVLHDGKQLSTGFGGRVSLF